MKMVVFIVNDDGTFSPCSIGGLEFITKYVALNAAIKKVFEAPNRTYEASALNDLRDIFQKEEVK